MGDSATGTIEYNGDRDWFAVTLEAGTLYRFDLEARWTGSSSTLRNPYLRGIYDANGDRIDGTTNDNGGESYDSRVYFTPDEGATYYVSAGGNGYNKRTGTYTLRVSEESGRRLRGRCHHDRDGCGGRLGHGQCRILRRPGTGSR